MVGHQYWLYCLSNFHLQSVEKKFPFHTCKRSQNQSHTFNICLTEVPLAWLESTSGSCLSNSRFYKLDLRNRVLTQKRERGRGGWGWIMLYVGYIAVIYRYQAFSFSLSSHKNEMLDQASAGSTHHGSWLQYIYCQVVVKWTWNHYLPSNLNFSLQGSYQSLLPSVLPNFKPRRDGYGLVCYGINNRRPTAK